MFVLLRPSAVGLVGSALLASCAAKTSPDPVSAEPEPLAIRVPEPSPTPSVEEPEPEPEIHLEGYEEVAEVLGKKWVSWMSAPVRMAVARRGAVRLQPGGAVHGLADGRVFGAETRLMVVDDGEQPRVVVDQGGARLLLHLDREDAQPVLMTRARLRPDPSFRFKDPPRRGHVIVERGTWVDVTNTQGDASEVRWTGRDQSWAGWIDTTSLGTTIGPAESAPSPDPAASDDDPPPPFRTKRATKLLVRPGGEVLVELEENDEVDVITEKARRGYRLVEYQPGCEGDVSYVGYVRTRDLFQPEYGLGYGCGRGGMGVPLSWGDFKETPRVKVEAGRFLLATNEPRVVGCVVKSFSVASLGDGLFAVPTIWGPVKVRLAPEGFDGACGTEQ